jgi:hypothetical protein
MEAVRTSETSVNLYYQKTVIFILADVRTRNLTKLAYLYDKRRSFLCAPLYLRDIHSSEFIASPMRRPVVPTETKKLHSAIHFTSFPRPNTLATVRSHLNVAPPDNEVLYGMRHTVVTAQLSSPETHNTIASLERRSGALHPMSPWLPRYTSHVCSISCLTTDYSPPVTSAAPRDPPPLAVSAQQLARRSMAKPEHSQQIMLVYSLHERTRGMSR